jgi:hypothetical protein
MSKEFTAVIERAVVSFEGRCKPDPTMLMGWDWWQLSRDEEAVFAIDRTR